MSLHNKLVNIGMVTFNRLAYTRQAIASIVRHTHMPYVITVVDNNSTDGTQDFLREQQRQGIIKNLIVHEKNYGVAAASNRAWLTEPHAAYFLKYDNDIVIEKDGWLEEMVRVIDALPFVAAVAYNFEPVSYPRMVLGEVTVRPVAKNLGGACFLIPQRTEQVLGYWCEAYGVYSEEDADYCERIRLLGYSHVYMDDEAVGRHLPAGRAARIDTQTLAATDGIEEHAEHAYRAFKDTQRQRVIAQDKLFATIIEEYQRGLRPYRVHSPWCGAKDTAAHEWLDEICRSNQRLLALKKNVSRTLWQDGILAFADVLVKNDKGAAYGDVIEEAVRILEQRAPKSDRAWYTLGSLYKQARQYHQALDAYRTIRDTADLYAGALFHQGETLFFMQQYQESLDVLQECLAIMPAHAKARQYVDLINERKLCTP